MLPRKRGTFPNPTALLENHVFPCSFRTNLRSKLPRAGEESTAGLFRQGVALNAKRLWHAALGGLSKKSLFFGNFSQMAGPPPPPPPFCEFSFTSNFDGQVENF